MNCTRVFTLVAASLLLFCSNIDAQRLDIKCIRKKSKAADCATIVFNVDLRYEREHGDSMINRLFDYFPLRITCEMDIVRLKDYFGFRVSAGKRLGGYLSMKLGRDKKGFNADESSDEVDVSKKSYMGRIRNSYMAGIKYGLISRDYPVFLYLGAGYGDDGSQRSNGKKRGKGLVEYYSDYTHGFESEMGASVILFDFLSISMGVDAIFGHRVVFDVNCTIGFAIDLTQ